ncbi:MAG: transposase [Bdellovibrionales bacterium]|nr:transposase [Bdellovibrionales bacterium]
MPLDTNHLERQIRPVAIGKKNSYDLCQAFLIH